MLEEKGLSKFICDALQPILSQQQSTVLCLYWGKFIYFGYLRNSLKSQNKINGFIISVLHFQLFTYDKFMFP